MKENRILIAVIAFIIGLALGFLLKNVNMKNENQQGAAKTASIETVKSDDSAVYNNPKCSLNQYYVESVCYNANQILTNTNNKLDYIGSIHNDGVKYVLSHWDHNATSAKTMVQDLTIEYMNSIGKPVDPKFFDQFDISSNPIVYPKSISRPMQDYLDQLKALINDETSFKSFHDNVVELEDKISSDSTLTKSQKDALLGATSIYRYSAFDAYVKSTTGTSVERKWLKWLFIISTDLVWGAIGSIGGPIGAAAAGIAGSALVGGL